MMPLAAITFTLPWMLLGIAAVALPIAAHLLSRRARQQIVFPTIRFLLQTAAAQSRLFRLRRLLLLLLRCLALVLIAAAFAQPVWFDRPSIAASADAPAALIIVLDDSASMAQTTGQTSPASDAAAQAVVLLDALRPGRDIANIIFARLRPHPAFDSPISNLDALRDDLRRFVPTAQRADLPAALASAAAMLQDHPGPRRIALITDLQQTNCDTLAPTIDRLRRSPLAPDIAVISVAPAKPAAAANVALSNPRAFPAQPTINSPAAVSVTVTNHAQVARSVTIRAAIGSAPLDPRRIRLEPREQADVSFDASFPSPADHPISFTLDEPDALPVDNAAHLIVRCTGPVPITLLSAASATDPTSATFFLSRALAPHASAPFIPTAVAALSASDTAPDAAPVIIALGDAMLSADALEQIRSHLQRGHTVLAFDRAAQQLAPTAFTPLADPIIAQLAADESLGPLRDFDELSRQALRNVVFTVRHTLIADPARGPALLRFADESPALLEHTASPGRLILASFSLDPRQTDLPRQGIFVPLMHSLIDHLRPAAEPRRPLFVGQPVQSTTPANLPGIYTLRPDSSDPSPAAAPAPLIAVNLDPLESDLSPLPIAPVTTAPAADATNPAAAPSTDSLAASLTDIDAAARSAGLALWPFLLIAALAAVAAELLLLTLLKA
jgi:hypothetical protein